MYMLVVKSFVAFNLSESLASFDLSNLEKFAIMDFCGRAKNRIQVSCLPVLNQ